MGNPGDWGTALQEAIDDLRASHARWAAAEPTLAASVAATHDLVARGFAAVVHEIRERHDAERREERQRIAAELVQIFDVVRNVRLDLDAHAVEARNRIVANVATSLAEPFTAVADLARDALRAVGLTVRDDGEPFDARFDTVVGTEAVEDRTSDRKVLRVTAPGFVWTDGGVYRPRHVVVGLFPEHEEGK